MENTEVLNSNSETIKEIEAHSLMPGFKITIVDQTGQHIKLGVVICEQIAELRDVLLENVNTCFFTNYYFEHSGKRLPESTELRSLDLGSDDRIFMREDEYTERTSKAHLR